MKTLYVPFYSMRSYKTGKWLLKRDGHATRCRNIINMLCTKLPFACFSMDIVIPANSDINTLQDFFQTYKIKNYMQDIKLIKNPYYADNAMTERMNFPYKFYKKILENNYELIIYENIENVRYVANMAPSAKIMSSITHGPTVECEDFTRRNNFFLRVVDGIFVCDKVFYNSPYIKTNLGKYFKQACRQLEINKLVHSYAYASLEEIESLNEFKDKEKNSILFLSRLSDIGRTKADMFFECLNKYNLSDYKIYITNPSDIEINKETKKMLKEKHVTLVKQNDRKDYIKLLHKVQTVIILYDVEKTYSTAYFEAHIAGCNVITLRHNHYLSEMNNLDFIVNYNDTKDLISKITDANFTSVKTIQARNFINKHFTVESQFEKLKNIILEKKS